MNRKLKRNKYTLKVAKWIVESILKLDDENLLNYYLIIKEELEKRGVIYDRSC